jgi:hypothetical protein
MLAVLGGLADVERDLIRTRTAEGRSRAKAKESTWADPLPSPGTKERSYQAARAGRYAGRTRPQLQCEQSYDFEAHLKLEQRRKSIQHMPYQTYIFGGIQEPSDKAARLWRYMDLPQFLTILDRQELFFPSIATLAAGDPYEGNPFSARSKPPKRKGQTKFGVSS